MNRTTMPIAYLCRAALLLPLCISSSMQAEEVAFDARALSKFGSQKYKMVWIDRSSGSPVERERGTMCLSATVAEDAVSLKNVTRMYLPDGKRFIEYHTSCSCSADDTLSLRRMTIKVVRSDEVVVHESETVVEQGTITHKFTADGRATTKQDRWIEGSVLDLAVFFLIPQLPRKKGRSVSIENVVSAPTNTIEKPERRVITCTGADRDTSTDAQTLTRFVNAAKGERDGIAYWVDDNGVLRRVLLSPENRLDLMTK